MSSTIAPLQVASRIGTGRPGSSPLVPRRDDDRETCLPHALDVRKREPAGRVDGRATFDPSVQIVEPAIAAARPVRADCGADEFAAALHDSAHQARLSAMVARIARSRYGIRADDAQDVFQDSVLTYLVVRDRYPRDANHFGLFFGVFRRTALSFLSAGRRRLRRLERLAVQVAEERRRSAADHAPEAALQRAERDGAIRDSIAALARDAKALLLELGEGRCRRLDLVARLGINRNTFDSRLRAARIELRRSLARHGGL